MPEKVFDSCRKPATAIRNTLCRIIVYIIHSCLTFTDSINVIDVDPVIVPFSLLFRLRGRLVMHIENRQARDARARTHMVSRQSAQGTFHCAAKPTVHSHQTTANGLT